MGNNTFDRNMDIGAVFAIIALVIALYHIFTYGFIPGLRRLIRNKPLWITYVVLGGLVAIFSINAGFSTR
jgi:hypothetical protein